MTVAQEIDIYPKINLRSHEVHLWWAFVQDVLADDDIHVLPSDEIERSTKYAFRQDRNRFIATRVMLRHILSQYLCLHPSEILFKYTSHGKPYLNNCNRGMDLEFNISHSEAISLCAVTRKRRVGVDVEHVKPMTDMEKVSAIAFSPAEQAQLSSLPNEHKLTGFFTCWTRKEAYIKARGEGFLLPINTCDVSFLPEEPPSLWANRLDPNAATCWSFYDIFPADGYIGSLVVEGNGLKICLRHWAER